MEISIPRSYSSVLGRRLARAALATLLVAGPALAQDKVQLFWKGKAIDAASVPAELDAAPRNAISEWLAWAETAGYRMDLDAQGKILVLSPADSERGEKALAVAARAQSWFDDVLPRPRPGESVAKAAPAKAAPAKAKPAREDPEEIPEDPEAPPPGAEKSRAKPATGTGTETTWGAGTAVPDSRTATLFVLHDEEDETSLVAFIAAAHADLREWAKHAKLDVGFVLESPLAAGFVENAAGQEEWNPEHEVLNRFVRLLTLSRFGQAPNWLVHAIAWEAETAFDGSIWVYPYRSEFVYTVEHTSWPADLQREFRERDHKPLEMTEIARWRRGTWDGSAARRAFGLFHYLTAQKKSSLPAMLETFRAQRDEQNRKSTGDGNWVRDPNWEPSPEDQLAILRSYFGDKVLDDAAAWLAKQGSARSNVATR